MRMRRPNIRKNLKGHSIFKTCVDETRAFPFCENLHTPIQTHTAKTHIEVGEIEPSKFNFTINNLRQFTIKAFLICGRKHLGASLFFF